MRPIQSRVESIDWTGTEAHLDAHGFAMLSDVLSITPSLTQ